MVAHITMITTVEAMRNGRAIGFPDGLDLRCEIHCRHLISFLIIQKHQFAANIQRMFYFVPVLCFLSRNSCSISCDTGCNKLE